MTLWYADPPQGVTSEQGLHIIGMPLSPRFGAPQGIGVAPPPPTGGSALRQTFSTGNVLVQTGTLSALIQTGSG